MRRNEFVITWRSFCLTLALCTFSFALAASAEDFSTGCLNLEGPPPGMRKSPPITLKGEYDNHVDLSEHFPPIGNQRSQNSCVGWAIGYYYKTYQEWQEHGWNVNQPEHQFSPAFIYNHINGGGNVVVSAVDGLNLVWKMGCATMADMPYLYSNWTYWPTENVYLNAINYRCHDFTPIDLSDPLNLDQLKALLLNEDIAVFPIKIYANYWRLRDLFTNGNYCLREVSGQSQGGHIVTICGFDDNRRTADGRGAFKMADQRGSHFGLGGYFWMSYQAVLSEITSDRVAFYSEDYINYTPTLIARFHVAHPDRYAIQHQFGVGTISQPDSTIPFFNWGPLPSSPLAFPASNIVVDLSEMENFLNPQIQKTIFMGSQDRNIGNSLVGEITFFRVEQLIWPAQSTSLETPVPIPDNGEYAYATLQVPLLVSIALSPINPPIQIPASGGSFTFTMTISNNGTTTQTFDYWSIITKPNGQDTTVIEPTSLTLLPGQFISPIITQQIASNEPSGIYTYTAYVGNHPSEIWDEDSFQFEKLTIILPPEMTWSYNFGGSVDEWGDNVRQTSDGGFIIAGETYSFGSGDLDAWVIKTDASGNQDWAYTYGGSFQDYAYDIRQTQDGGYIVVGGKCPGSGPGQLWLFKLSSGGVMQWERTWGGSNWDYGFSVQQTPDLGYIVGGITGSYTYGNYDFWLIKTYPNGDMTWNQHFGGTGWDQCNSIDQTNDGGYVMVGRTFSYGVGVDMWLVKTNSNGIMQWSRNYGGTAFDEGFSVQHLPDGGYIIAGGTESYGIGGDIWLVKTDADGYMVWDRMFGGDGVEFGFGLDLTMDGGYVISGRTTSFGAGSDDVWVVRTDGEGDEIWNGTYGGSNWDEGHSIETTTDGGFIVAGNTNTYTNGGLDIWLVRLEPETASEGFASSLKLQYSASLPYKFAFNCPYPNPFNATTVLSFQLPVASHVKLEIFDVTGRIVGAHSSAPWSGSGATPTIDGWRQAGTHEVTFDGSNLPSGIYIARLQAGDFVGVQKLVLLK